MGSTTDFSKEYRTTSEQQNLLMFLYFFEASAPTFLHATYIFTRLLHVGHSRPFLNRTFMIKNDI